MNQKTKKSHHSRLWHAFFYSLFCKLDFVFQASKLVVESTNTVIDDVEHGLSSTGSGDNKSSKSKHSEASVPHFNTGVDSRLHVGHVTVAFSSGEPVVTRVVRVNQKGVRPRSRTDGSHKRDSEGVHVGSKDNSTFSGDGLLAHDASKGAPLLHVKCNIGIRDQAVALGVSSANDHDPSEHSVASIPLLGKDRWTPAVLGEGGKFLFPALLSIFISLGADDVWGGDARGDVQRTEMWMWMQQ